MNKKIIFLIIALTVTFSNKGLSFERGVCAHFDSYSEDPVVYLKALKQIGASSIRVDYQWNKIERTKGKYVVSRPLEKTDAAINQSSLYGLNNLLILDYGNSLYDNGGYPTTRDGINAFANYTKWVVKKNKGKIKYYEVWNEWKNGTGMPPAMKNTGTAKGYFEIVKRVSRIIKENDPNAIILAGSFNPLTDSDNAWFYELLELGILDYIDGISIHPYSYKNENIQLRTAAANLNAIDQFYDKLTNIAHRKTAIYITEIGIPNYDGIGGVNEIESSIFRKNYIKLASERSYIKGVWWYDLKDDGTNKSFNEHNFGIFKANMTLKKNTDENLSLKN